MTYNPNIPLGTDNISTSQGQINTNFTQLKSIFANDHFTWDFATSAKRGYHQQVNIAQNAGAPTAQLSPGAVLYGKKDTTTNNTMPAWIMSTAYSYTIPLVINVGTVAVTPGTPNVNNFTGYPPMTGTVMAYDLNQKNRTLISPFVWDGSSVSFPGESTAGSGQVASGDKLLYFLSVGAQAKIKVATISTNINVRYFGDITA